MECTSIEESLVEAIQIVVEIGNGVPSQMALD